MASKQLMFGSDAKVQLKKGLDQLASAVKVTMGPTGRNVILQKSFGNPHITKDGVTVSKEIDLPQQFQNMGAKMVNEVAKKTADKAGDGTTTATVLAQAIFSEGLRHVTAGANPIVLQRGITAASKIACDAIDGIAKKCKGLEDLQNVACVSANHDASIGNIIAEAINHVGEWFLIGTEGTGHWGRELQDVTNQFVLEAVRGGCLGLVFFSAVLFLVMRANAIMAINARDKVTAMLNWGFFSALFSMVFSFIGVSIFGSVISGYFLLQGAAISFAQASEERVASRARRKPRNNPPPRRPPGRYAGQTT